MGGVTRLRIENKKTGKYHYITVDKGSEKIWRDDPYYKRNAYVSWKGNPVKKKRQSTGFQLLSLSGRRI